MSTKTDEGMRLAKIYADSAIELHNDWCSEDYFEETREALRAHMQSMEDAAQVQQEPAARDIEWQAINRVQQHTAGVIIAAVNLLAAVDERHDTQDAPQKYTVPYGAVNALRAALDSAPAATPPQGARTEDQEREIHQLARDIDNGMGDEAAMWAGRELAEKVVAWCEGKKP